MKLPGLASTTQRPTRETIERGRPADDERIRRVEVLEGIEGDRQRSLQQEIAEIVPGAIAEFSGGEHVLQEARDMAAQLTSLGPAAADLIKPTTLPAAVKGIDDTA